MWRLGTNSVGIKCGGEMIITSMIIKEQSEILGCDLCGIASIDRFKDIPEISNPQYLMKGAKSVLVVAKRFLNSTLDLNSTIPYTIIRNYLSRKIDETTIRLSYFIEREGFNAVPTGVIEPCNYSSELNKTVGLLSLKNAAYQAGLGVIGKNTLLITPEFGNMVWLGAVVTNLDLEPDEVKTINPCKENCKICIKSCPVNAIDGSPFINQKKCWDYAFGKPSEGGEWRIKCYNCRNSCPLSKGYNL